MGRNSLLETSGTILFYEQESTAKRSRQEKNLRGYAWHRSDSCFVLERTMFEGAPADVLLQHDTTSARWKDFPDVRKVIVSRKLRGFRA